MKRLILAAATLFALVLPSLASAQYYTTAQQQSVPLTFRKFNTSNVSGVDSSYVIHAAARVDTTNWISLRDFMVGAPNFAPATIAADSAFVFKLFLGTANVPTTTGGTPVVATSDSFYVLPQFAELNSNTPIGGLAAFGFLGTTGTGQAARVFNTLPTCTYATNSFYGAQAIRFIVTWPASSTTAYLSGSLTGYMNNESRRR